LASFALMNFHQRPCDGYSGLLQVTIPFEIVIAPVELLYYAWIRRLS
jgi:hypothetical protein